jgi:hypothetical protein
MSQTYVCDFEMRPLLIDTIVEQNFTRKRVGDAQSINYYDILHTVPCGPLCHDLTCTHKYSPLWSTLPCSHMYSYVQSLAVHYAIPWGLLCRALLCAQIAQPAEYLRNPPVA